MSAIALRPLPPRPTGRRVVTDNVWATCQEEAGHALVLFLCGIPIQELTAFAHGGHCTPAVPLADLGSDVLAVWGYAGPAARNRPDDLSDDDRAIVLQARLSQRELYRWQRHAARLVFDHRSAINTIAYALAERGHLGAASCLTLARRLGFREYVRACG